MRSYAMPGCYCEHDIQHYNRPIHNKHTQRGSYRTSTLQLNKQKAHEDYQYWGLRSVAEGSTRHNNDNIGTGTITPHMRTFKRAAEGSSLRHVNRNPT